MQSTGGVYVLGDGDKIREKIEYYLLNHDIESLSNFSQNLTVAINEIKEVAISTMSAQIILAGGDDILFYVPREKYQIELLQKLQQVFLNITGATISFGVGKTIEAAYINLRKAKSSRDRKIVEEVSTL
jgi:hypothetical protein